MINILQRLLIPGAGLILGYLTWLTAQHFIIDYTNQEQTSEGKHLSSLTALSLGIPLGLGMACWSGYVAWRTSDPPIVTTALVTTAIFLVIALVDYAVHRIPNKMVMTLLIWTAAQILWLGQPSIRSAVLGSVLGGGIFLLLAIIGRGALGVGDVKLIAAEGAILGYPLILHGMFWGIIFGGVAAIILLITQRAGSKDNFAYGPYLALGAWIIFLGMINLLPWQH